MTIYIKITYEDYAHPNMCIRLYPAVEYTFCHLVTGKDWSKVVSASLKALSGYDSEPHRVLPALGIWLIRRG